MFSDGPCGGRAAALLCAIAWRDQKKDELGIPNTHLYVSGASRNNTGVRGVSWSEVKERYLVSWVDAAGRPGNTSVSARKCGKKKAFQHACSIRKEKEEGRLAGNIFPSGNQRPKINRDNVTYSEKDLIYALQDVAQQLGRTPTSRDFKNKRPATHRFETKFGGWNKALLAAGLKEQDA